MSALDAVAAVLSEAGAAMKVNALTDAILERGSWKSHGKTPAATIEARLSTDIKKRGMSSRFVRTAPRTYGLNPSVTTTGVTDPPAVRDKHESTEPEASEGSTLSFNDATEKILRDFGGGKPMHYRDIAERALELKLIKTAGKTPEATVYAQIYQEGERRRKRGQTPRFVRLGNGMIGLTEWSSGGLSAEIDQHNQAVKKQLLKVVSELTPAGFEALVGTLLAGIGFQEVIVTKVTGDGGIDARGVLVVGESIRIRMGIQAKRWKANVRSPIVQQVRGSLGAHERGLIVTTSDYSPGARKEATRSDAAPLALMNGAELVDLLVENRIGVSLQTHDLLALGPLEQGLLPAAPEVL